MLRTRLAPAGLVLALALPFAQAQTEHGGRPLSEQRQLRRAVPTFQLPPVHVAELLAEDAAADTKGPVRFGEARSVELDLANAGVWEELGGGDHVWRLRVRSPGAKSLSLVFRRFRMPEGGVLFVHDDARATVRGAYTDLENRLDGEFAIRPTRGDALTLEYFEPARARGRGELALASVVHDYRDVIALLEDRSGTGGGASSCEVDVACPLGANWADQIDAAVHVVALPLGLLCSGSLLNNTANDGTILVLTAAHCTGLTNAAFTFNFEKPGCRTGTGPTTDVLVGATQLVVDEALDVQLVRVNAPQGPLPFRAFLAGWDRSGTTPGSSVIIHHPQGDVKKISFDADSPTVIGNFWRILDWERGVTEAGSSGSPMFDPAGRFIGNLDSGSSRCPIPTNDSATRLFASWPVLEPYLDPFGLGKVTIDGLDVDLAPIQPFAVFGCFPKQIEALVPGIARTMRVNGSGFGDATTLALDGAPLDPARFVRGGHSSFAVDLPQLPLGPHAFRVTDGATSVDVPFTVIAAPEPRYQLNEGIAGEFLFSTAGIDTLHADLPGHLHYVYWSLSNVPSSSARIKLLIGNGFTDLHRFTLARIPATGFVAQHHGVPPGALPLGTRVYSQAACISHGVPLRTSGVQENVFQF